MSRLVGPFLLAALVGGGCQGCWESPSKERPGARSGEGLASGDEGTISEEDRRTLLVLARRSVVASLSGLEPSALTDGLSISPRLQQPQGAFVTLKAAGQLKLRGCIGTIMPVHPLYQAVILNARNAAHDSRFRDRPVTLGELDRIRLEISALSVPVPVSGPTDIDVGKHGIILTHGQRSSTFLPHIATEQGWDRDTALSQLARKVGLSPAVVSDPATRFQVYTAEIWHE